MHITILLIKKHTYGTDLHGTFLLKTVLLACREYKEFQEMQVLMERMVFLLLGSEILLLRLSALLLIKRIIILLITNPISGMVQYGKPSRKMVQTVLQAQTVFLFHGRGLWLLHPLFRL